MRNKIALFVPYFGKLPTYFPFFINSLKDQPFTIFIVSDAQYSSQLPENCEWLKIKFLDFITLVEKKIQLKINIKSAYKLCDFRPMYGEIFTDYLVAYDFWGNIDPDTIMGKFTNFINDELLDSIDFYSGVKEYLSGPLFLVRNKIEINKLWRKSKSIDIICKSFDYLGFDECGGRYWDKLKSGKSIFDCNTPIQSFTELIKIEENLGLRTCFRNTTLEPKGFQPVIFKNKEIFYIDKQYMLLHLLYFKTKFYFFIPNFFINYQYINSFGFFSYNPNSLKFFVSPQLFNWVKKKLAIQLRKLSKS